MSLNLKKFDNGNVRFTVLWRYIGADGLPGYRIAFNGEFLDVDEDTLFDMDTWLGVCAYEVDRKGASVSAGARHHPESMS